MTGSGPLATKLRRLHEEAVLRQAETIRGWPEGDERTRAAETHVRLALFECPSRIGEATRRRVYSLLSFVMPGDAAWADEATPDAVLERQAEWELEYQRQLERRSCPECGDGVCPTGE